MMLESIWNELVAFVHQQIIWVKSRPVLTYSTYGYSAPQRHELTGKDGQPLTLMQLLEAIGDIGDDE